MRIDDWTRSVLRPYPPNSDRVPGSDGSGTGQVQPNSVTDRTDRVTISGEARALADQQPEGAIPSDRLARIKAQVLSGAYDSPQTIELLARRILAAGEV